MKPPRRRIRLSYVNTNESVLAELLEDEASGVCEHVWDLLPVEAKVIHGMYSGAEVFLMLEDPRPAPRENLVQLPLPGELLYFFDESIGAAGGRKPVAEIVVVYGRGVVLRAHEGVPTHCQLFARVPGDWKYDWQPFAQACRRARWEGPQVLRIERAD
ncbi:MAG TPA: DUF3830 family protein [Candidatus Saccharimonadales bacterium]|nr:DUF3830 family protein [Candidatus Saccharimonadales bacterium]